MIINNNSVEQINIALLDLEKKILTIKDNKSDIDNLRDGINTIKASLNETKAGLTSGATYDINITGNATTATTANTAGSAVSAESAERASKDGNGNSITGTYATKEELANTNNELKSIVPVGVIYPFGGSDEKVPAGYLPCDGREVSRTQYSALFNVIGTSFGNGDNVSTFNVPDLRECVPVGIGTRSSGVSTHDTYALGQFKDDQFKSHNHDASITGGEHSHSVRTGRDGPYLPAVAPGGHAYFATGGYERTSTDGHSHGITISNRGGETTHGKQVGVNYIIKY